MDEVNQSSPEDTENTSPPTEEQSTNPSNGESPPNVNRFASRSNGKVDRSSEYSYDGKPASNSDIFQTNADTTVETSDFTISFEVDGNSSKESENYLTRGTANLDSSSLSEFSYSPNGPENTEEERGLSAMVDKIPEDFVCPEVEDNAIDFDISESHPNAQSDICEEVSGKARKLSDAPLILPSNEPTGSEVSESEPTQENSGLKESHENSRIFGKQEEASHVVIDSGEREVEATTVTNESDHQGNGETEESSRMEGGRTQPCEGEGTREIRSVQVGIEKELSLEEFLVPLEATLHSDDGREAELPKATAEEITLPDVNNHRVHRRANEIVEPTPLVSIEANRHEEVCQSKAKIIHHASELQTVSPHTPPVEFLTSRPGREECTIGDANHEVSQEPDMSEVQTVCTKNLDNESFIPVSITVPEIKQFGEETGVNINATSSLNISPLCSATKALDISDDKENATPKFVEALGHDMQHVDGRDNARRDEEPNPADEELDFDIKYALFVGKVLPGHEIYYMPPVNSKKKQVTFRRVGTLDQRRTLAGNPPLWESSLSVMRVKSATLEGPRHNRRRLQPQPAVNDDHLFPDSVTPSKVEKALSEDDTSAFNEDGNRYDVPFMDDDAFVPKKYRSVVVVDEYSSSESDYSDERIDLLGTEHLAKMDETSSHLGLTAIDEKRNISHEGASRWTLGLSICGCLRRRR